MGLYQRTDKGWIIITIENLKILRKEEWTIKLRQIKIYYAHHIWKYDTKIEQYEIDLIKSNFIYSKIINPNGTVDQSKDENEIMNDCFNCIKNCDILVFSSISGVVGKGVFEEVMLAKKLGKSIYYLENNQVFSKINVEFKVLQNSNNNRIYAVVL